MVTRTNSQALPFALALLLSAVGCTSSDESQPVELPWPNQAVGAVPEPAANPTTAAKVELGRMLFYDPLLSTDRLVACATCHSEIWGMGDALPISVGVDGIGPPGPGRHGPNTTRRNAPTLWNIGFVQDLFWDGRSASLEEQALLPLEEAVELGRDIDEVIADMRGFPGYEQLFAEAFPDAAEPVDATNMSYALAALQRTFVSSRAPYDRYAAGDVGALKPEAVAGMWAFQRGGCADCHVPPLFASDMFAARGAKDAVEDDEGRFEVTADPADLDAFRVPTLRNLRETGPYFHGGDVIELEEAVALEADRPRLDGSSTQLTAVEVAAIAVFLRKGLMDRSREPYRPKEVPSGLQVPIDGLSIPR